MNEYETRRLENIKRNQLLLLDLKKASRAVNGKELQPRAPPSKKRKFKATTPATRTSARIKSNGYPKSYSESALEDAETNGPKPASENQRTSKGTGRQASAATRTAHVTTPTRDIAALRAAWTSWKPVAPLPTRNANATFHFSSHPDFTPNKSPEEMLRQGCFGGSYFRPLRSAWLGIMISDDWRELPSSWTAGLDVNKFLVSPEYDADVNKFKVACGQSIEEWEAAGWIAHEFDVRGWFQWYCRFFMGRRCEDDERQVGRWRRCVGQTGRWRRTLLKKYVALGVREVFDDGEDDDRPDVSPVVHQTCHHWAFEVRQDALDDFWTTGK